jgi:hypothetical protein
MVSSNSLGNDPEKERLCASRVGLPGKIVPFEIDARYVASAKARHHDVTFIAVDGISPQLVECYLREGTGKYEPALYSPEQAYWHTLKPAGSGISTEKARSKAIKVCLDSVYAKLNGTGFDHSVNTEPFEVDINRAGTLIAGEKAYRYDVVVGGKSFFKSLGPDLNSVSFSCLLTRSLELRSLQIN